MKINHGPMSNYDKTCLNIKINHDSMLDTSEKDYVNMKINHSKPWSTMLILGYIIFFLGFICLRFIVLIPWV